MRYRADDLSEGVVETIDEANALELRESWAEMRNDGTTVTRFVVVGEIHRDRWDSVVVLDHADA